MKINGNRVVAEWLDLQDYFHFVHWERSDDETATATAMANATANARASTRLKRKSQKSIAVERESRRVAWSS